MTMVNDVINGIAKKLRTVCECKIYKDNIPQGMEEPCFFINPVSPSCEQQLGTRERRIYPFDVVYMPKTERRGEIYSVSDKLMLALRIIDTEFAGKLRGRDMSFEIVDGVLHFMVRYDFSIYQKPQLDNPMESMSVKGELKNER